MLIDMLYLCMIFLFILWSGTPGETPGVLVPSGFRLSCRSRLSK